MSEHARQPVIIPWLPDPPELRRCPCPVCGREMRLPVHRTGMRWTELQLHWVRRLLAAGLNRKRVARLMGVGPTGLMSALNADARRR